MATDQYAVVRTFLDQQPLIEEIDVDMDYNPDLKIAVTQIKGFAGVTKGAGSLTATITNAVPKTGPEIDYFEYAKNATAVEFVAVIGSTYKISKGFITNVKLKAGASQETRVDFTFHGEEPRSL